MDLKGPKMDLKAVRLASMHFVIALYLLDHKESQACSFLPGHPTNGQKGSKSRNSCMHTIDLCPEQKDRIRERSRRKRPFIQGQVHLREGRPVSVIKGQQQQL